MHSKSDNTEIMIYDKADKVIEELSESLLNGYHIALGTSLKGSDFFFYYVNLLNCKYHKTNLKHGGLYKGSPDWTENKKTAINLINDDNKYFQ